MERAVHKVRRLRWETGKEKVKQKVPDTYFFIDRSSLPEPYV